MVRLGARLHRQADIGVDMTAVPVSLNIPIRERHLAMIDALAGHLELPREKVIAWLIHHLLEHYAERHGFADLLRVA